MHKIGSYRTARVMIGPFTIGRIMVGPYKVYPNSSLAVTQSLAFAAAGGPLALSIQVEDGQGWSISGLPAGWSASATSGSGTASVTITAPNNTTTAPKSGTITVISEDLSATCAISQAAGAIHYGTPIVTAFGYPDIPAAGGTVAPNVYAYEQVYTWNGVPGSGGVLTTGGTVYFSSGNPAGQAWAASIGTEVRGRTAIVAMTTRVDMNGVTGQNALCYVYQAANNVERYDYRVVVVSSGSTIPWGGGSTLVKAKSQRAATYTSGATGGYEDTTAQSISASVYPSPFTVDYILAVDAFNVYVGATSQASQRTATVTFTGSIGGSATTTVRQAAMPYYGEFRYAGTNQASKNPRCAVNGNPDQTRQYYSYWEALKGVNGNAVTYYNGTCQASQGTGDVDAYVFFGYDSGWGVNGLGFKSGKQQSFMQNYPYTYITVYFEAIGETSSGWPHGALPGMALFEKSYGDFTYGWPPSSMFSAPEARAMSLLAENGAVTAADDPEIADVDFAALAEKINAMRVPDTNSYTQNEDGTWTVTPPHKS